MILNVLPAIKNSITASKTNHHYLQFAMYQGILQPQGLLILDEKKSSKESKESKERKVAKTFF